VQEDIADGKITRKFAEQHHGAREPEPAQKLDTGKALGLAVP
jgi:hypothetical protein